MAGERAMGRVVLLSTALFVSGCITATQARRGPMRSLQGFGIGDVTSGISSGFSDAGSTITSGAINLGNEATKAANTVTPVASDVANGDNSAAVNQIGTDLNNAGVDNSCNDNTLGSKVCNGVFGGAAGANSVATDIANTYTPGTSDPQTDYEKAGQTVSDALVNSAGYNINQVGQDIGQPNINNCKGESVVSQGCDELGGAEAVNHEVSGAAQVTAAALAGTDDATATQEIANAAAPAVVNDVGNAAQDNGIDTSCTDGSATANLCQSLGGANAVNGAVTAAANEAVSTGVDAASGDVQDNSNAAPSSPDSSSGGGGGGCCCWDAGANPGKDICQDDFNWCGSSGCN